MCGVLGDAWDWVEDKWDNYEVDWGAVSNVAVGTAIGMVCPKCALFYFVAQAGSEDELPLAMIGGTGLGAFKRGFVRGLGRAAAAGGGRTALAARFGTTAERTAVLERAITAEGGLNTSAKVAGQLAGQRSYIPTQSILDTIGSGARVADPQGAAGHFMYRAAASFNGSQGTLEVLVHEASGQIRHVLFRSGVAP